MKMRTQSSLNPCSSSSLHVPLQTSKEVICCGMTECLQYLHTLQSSEGIISRRWKRRGGGWWRWRILDTIGRCRASLSPLGFDGASPLFDVSFPFREGSTLRRFCSLQGFTGRVLRAAFIALLNSVVAGPSQVFHLLLPFFDVARELVEGGAFRTDFSRSIIM